MSLLAVISNTDVLLVAAGGGTYQRAAEQLQFLFSGKDMLKISVL
jgi:hypothetical protein